MTDRKTFRQWLKTQRFEDTHIGDLAVDAFDAIHWVGDDPASLENAMHRYKACLDAYTALDEAAACWLGDA